MAKYVKLGKKAEIFFDPTTRTKILKGQVVKLEDRRKFSKKISAAIAGGHLIHASKEDFNDYMEDVNSQNNKNTSANGSTVKTGSTEDTDWIEAWLSANELTDKNLKPLKKDKLVELVKHFESELSKEEIEDLSKAELIEEILDITSEYEEDSE